MNSEKIISTVENNVITLKTPETKDKIFPRRVDINDMLSRVRKEKQKENLINSIFFALFAVLIVVSGILLSL